MSALQLAKPLLPKQVTSVIDSQTQLKGLERELDYSKKIFVRFESIVQNVREFANVWEFRLCALDEAEFFFKEWEKQLSAFELDAQQNVFNAVLNAGIRSLNAEGFRKRLANFNYLVQSVQLNVILEVNALIMQLNTAHLVPDPDAIINGIRAQYSQPCTAHVSDVKTGTTWDMVPKDWTGVGQILRNVVAPRPNSNYQEYSPGQAKSYEMPELSETPVTLTKSFLTPELLQSLNRGI